jgi:hypothetical protein
MASTDHFICSYGAPDVFFPASWIGKWRCQLEITDLLEASSSSNNNIFSGGVVGPTMSPYKSKSVDPEYVYPLYRPLLAVYTSAQKTLSFDVRFIQHNGNVVMDRFEWF